MAHRLSSDSLQKEEPKSSNHNEIIEHQTELYLSTPSIYPAPLYIILHLSLVRGAEPLTLTAPHPMSSNPSKQPALSPEEILKKLSTSQQNGLAHEEVLKRLARDGKNSLSEKKESGWIKLLRFFWGPIPWMIEIAIVLSAVLERIPDLIVISSLLFINAALGFIQEFKAGKAIDALKSKLALKARVLREGKWQDIEASELVVGDIVQVKLGNVIPADIYLLDGEYLSIDQSALTGESLPVSKKIGETAYSGTIAKLGQMVGVVTATGMRTFFGKTAKLVTEAKTTSHLQQAILFIGKLLIYITLAIAAIMITLEILRIEVWHTGHETLGDLVIFILVVVVGGIPVALPAVLSVTMAIGANKMSKLKAIVSKLIAIEELAGMDTLCSDKTGTLTKNSITVHSIYPATGFTDQDVVKYAALASDPKGNDPIDLAILDQPGVDHLFDHYQIHKFTPFDPTSKRIAALFDGQGEKGEAYKGASNVLLDLCKLSQEQQEAMMSQVEKCASEGMRTLGVCRQQEGASQIDFLGLIALYDPPREDTRKTIQEITHMGIDVKMVTGDHVDIAKQIASELGIGTDIQQADTVFDSKSDTQSTIDKVEKLSGFAGVFPEHKFQIVQTLQQNQHVVGMTGDGVNDAPALKQADIGIAVSNATDAARAAADLILTRPGLSVISRAIEESRKVFGRMKSYAIYRVSETCRLLFFLLLSSVIFNDRPLTAMMIILIALLNDIPIMTISYDHMSIAKQPTRWNMKEVIAIALGLAIVGVISTFGLYWIGLKYWKMSHTLARTLAFMALLCGGNLTIYLTRNDRWLFSKPRPEWKFFTATLLSQVAGTLLGVYGLGTKDFLGIGWKFAALSWGYILIWFGLCILTKRLLYLFIPKAQKTSADI